MLEAVNPILAASLVLALQQSLVMLLVDTYRINYDVPNISILRCAIRAIEVIHY